MDIHHITALWQNRQWTLLDAAYSKCLQDLRTSTKSGQKNQKSNENIYNKGNIWTVNCKLAMSSIPL